MMGTFVVVTLRGTNRAAALRAMDAAFASVEAVDASMSLHKSDSELSRLNATAFERPVVVSSNLFHVIGQALDIARRSGGAFDPTLRPVVDLWGFVWREYRMPDTNAIRRALGRTGHAWVALDGAARSVKFMKEGLSLDLGGIAKGHAVDRAMETLASLGWTNAMVRAGGDLRISGTGPAGAPWEVQLEDPQRRGVRARIALRDGALSTSGDYENYFEMEGRRYSHLLDPRTGWPVEGVAACSVMAGTCLESDAWATAAFVLGPGKYLGTAGWPFPARFTVRDAGGGAGYRVMASPDFPAALD